MTTIRTGDIVRYHGSIRPEHGTIFYVSAIEPTGRYELTDRDYPAVTVLSHVRRNSFSPTGERVDLCVCGHDAHSATRAGTCGAPPCHCQLTHGDKHSTTTVKITRYAPEPARPGARVARWAYNYTVNDGPLCQYGPGLASLLSRLKFKHPTATIVRTWDPARLDDDANR